LPVSVGLQVEALVEPTLDVDELRLGHQSRAERLERDGARVRQPVPAHGERDVVSPLLVERVQRPGLGENSILGQCDRLVEDDQSGVADVREAGEIVEAEVVELVRGRAERPESRPGAGFGVARDRVDLATESRPCVLLEVHACRSRGLLCVLVGAVSGGR
jgi:hypothetical protein